MVDGVMPLGVMTGSGTRGLGEKVEMEAARVVRGGGQRLGPKRHNRIMMTEQITPKLRQKMFLQRRSMPIRLRAMVQSQWQKLAHMMAVMPQRAAPEAAECILVLSLERVSSRSSSHFMRRT